MYRIVYLKRSALQIDLSEGLDNFSITPALIVVLPTAELLCKYNVQTNIK